jgi:precorrin-8X/cobalt-precorrin-8 methylmutase
MTQIPLPAIEHVAPEDIERLSLSMIESEVPEPRPFAGDEWQVVRRMIHASADFELLSLTRFHPAATAAGIAAIGSGACVFADTKMCACGMPERRLAPLGGRVFCLLDDPRVTAAAAASGVTRARAAVDLAVAEHVPDIYVIGNAPTALLALLEHIRSGRARPRLVIGMPVGFVNAAESKAYLAAQDAVPYITVQGRKGGSPLAASAFNALAELALAGRGR